MEFQILVDGEPVTDWEQVRARDVDLWIDTLNLPRDAKVSVSSRKVGTPDTTPSMSLSRDELSAIADGLGIDVPSGATKAQILAAIV